MVLQYSEMTDQERKEFKSKLLHLVENYDAEFNQAKEMIEAAQSRHKFDEVGFGQNIFKP